jgi:hypothetical protein
MQKNISESKIFGHSRKALLYIGCGSDISPALSNEVAHGRFDEPSVMIFCDPGSNAIAFYNKLSVLLSISSEDFHRRRPHDIKQDEDPTFVLQLVGKPHKLDDDVREVVGLPRRDSSLEADNARAIDYDWLEVDVHTHDQPLRRYRFLPFGSDTVIRILDHWRMTVDTLAIIRQGKLFDSEGNIVRTQDWIEGNTRWIRGMEQVWTDTPGPWTDAGWVPSVRMLNPLTPINRTSADRPVWCLNAPAEKGIHQSDDIMMHGLFDPRAWDQPTRSIAGEERPEPKNSPTDIHWADPGKWLFVTNPPERFYKGSSSAYKLIMELPEGIEYVIDTQTMNSQLYKVQNRFELKKQSTGEQKSIYTLIELLQSGHGVAVRVRDLDDAVDVIEQAYRLERIPSPGRAAIVAKLRSS